MGQEAEKAQRLKDFSGYQVTEELCREGGANPHWKFMHCLPRKPPMKSSLAFQGHQNWSIPLPLSTGIDWKRSLRVKVRWSRHSVAGPSRRLRV